MLKHLVKRIIPKCDSSFFIFGPRGTGKSTWIKDTYPESLIIDLLDPSQLRKFSASPEHLMHILDVPGSRKVVVIDEVQRVPSLLDVVHSYMENRGDRQFILTGSSSRKLKRSGVNLLAGRAEQAFLHPFLPSELGDRFDLENALTYGLLPLVQFAKNPKATLRAYLGLYLKDEVQAEGLVRNLDGFSRFLEAISFSHGGILSYSEVSRECQVERKSVEGFVDILSDLLLGYKLPVFSKKAKRKLISHQKFYYFDTGVFRSIRPKGPLDRPEEIHGAALEGLVCQCLKAYADYRKPMETCELFFWRTQADSEVDFVLYGEETILALEVKNSGKVHKNDLRHLKTFCSDYPSSQAILLYRGKETVVIDGILCLPCEKLLKALSPERSPSELVACVAP